MDFGDSSKLESALGLPASSFKRPGSQACPRGVTVSITYDHSNPGKVRVAVRPKKQYKQGVLVSEEI
jgi:hypothetical protein